MRRGFKSYSRLSTILFVMVLLTFGLSVNAFENRFEPGQCTWYAAEKFQEFTQKPITWSGHAGTWLEGTSSQGWETTTDIRAAQRGAVVVWTGSGKTALGHVAFVESVSGQTVNISELNYYPDYTVVQHNSYTFNEINRINSGGLVFRGYILPYQKGVSTPPPSVPISTPIYTITNPSTNVPVYVPYGSIQCRVQRNESEDWALYSEIKPGQSIRVGTMHDASGNFADSAYIVQTVTGPNQWAINPGIGDYISPPYIGKYTVVSKTTDGRLTDSCSFSVIAPTNTPTNKPTNTLVNTSTPVDVSPTPTATPSGIIPQMILSKDKEVRGSIIQLSVNLTNVKATDKTNSAAFEIEYDGSSFELALGNINNDIIVGYIPFNTKLDINLYSKKKIVLTYTDLANDIKLQNGTRVFSINFKVKSDCALGLKSFSLKPVEILD